jgi:O-antigen/teichoic acid export membrane protein
MRFINKYINDLKNIFKSKSAQDSIIVFLGNLFSKSLTLLFTIILARKLGVDSFGNFSIALSFMGLISQFTDLGITTGFIRYASLYIEENKDKAAALVKITLKFKIIISLFALTVGWFISPYLAKYIFNDESMIFLLKLSFLGAFGNSMYGYGKSLLRSYELFKKFTFSNIFIGLLKILFLFFISILSMINLNSSFIIVIIVPFIAAIFNAILIPKNLMLKDYDKNIEKEVFRELFNFSKWTMLSSFILMFISRLDLFMLKALSNSAEVGYFSGAQKLAMIFPVITNSLISVLLPKVSKIKNKNKLKKFIFKSLKATTFIVIPFVLLIIFSKPIIVILLGKDFLSSIPIFKIILVAYIFGVIVNPISLILYNLNRAYILTAINFIQLIINYFGNLYLIPEYGGIGASIMTTIVRIIGSIFITATVFYLLSKGAIKNDIKQDV